MSATVFLVDTLFSLYLMVVILRLWLQLARADFYNPMSQFVVKATHPIVGPLRRIVPSIGRLDTATLVLAIVVAALKLIALGAMAGAGLNPVTILILAVITVVKEALSLMFWVLQLYWYSCRTVVRLRRLDVLGLGIGICLIWFDVLCPAEVSA